MKIVGNVKEQGKYLLFLFWILFAISAIGQTIPFEFFNNQILVKVSVGDSEELNFLFDTGVDPSVVDLEVARQKSITIDTSHYGVASGRGADRNKVFPVNIPKMNVAGTAVSDLESLAFDMTKLSEKYGKKLHGILGYSFLKNKIFKVDYNKQEITFYNSSIELNNSFKKGVYEAKFYFEDEDNIPVVKDFLLNGRPLIASIDLGSSLGVQLYTHQLNKFEIKTESLINGKSLQGAAGSQATFETDVRSVAIDDYLLGRQHISISAVKDTSQVRMGNIGNRFLQNFILSFDYTSKTIFFEPGKDLKRFVSYGFDFITTASNKIMVAHHLPAQLRLDREFKLFGEYNFKEFYNDAWFNASTATYFSDSALIIVHAGEHALDAGTFDYANLKKDTINGYPSYLRMGCYNLFEQTEEDLKENKYMSYLKDNGYDFNQGLFMVQFLVLNKEKNAEIVLSYARQMKECPETRNELNPDGLKRMAKQVFSSFRLK